MVETPLALQARPTKLLLAGCLLLGAGLLIKLDAAGYIGAHVLGRGSRAAAPVMQYGDTMVRERLPPGMYSSAYSGVGSQDSLRGRDSVVPLPFGKQGTTPSWNGGRWGGTSTGPSEYVTMPQEVPGGHALRTWQFEDPTVKKVQVEVSTIGRPLNASIEVWKAVSRRPVQIRAYSEDGEERPFSAVLCINGPGTVAIRNTNSVEFPVTALVDSMNVAVPASEHVDFVQNIEGGSLRTFPMGPGAEAVEIVLETDGRPLNARIEILQGPNEDKQFIEFETDDGMKRPFFFTLNTPWHGGGTSVVKVINTGPVEFPLFASVVPRGDFGRYL